MKVIAFIGAAGTGKSHHALVVAHDNDIECIIDDGLLIYQNRIIAGRSAKQERNQLKAVRRAVFNDKLHAAEVKKALHRIGPAKLLVLGTSVHMIEKISQALDIPHAETVIRIEDVSTAEEITTAHTIRVKEGKHVIPVPTMELKPHFKGYLLDPIKSFFNKKNGKKAQESYERSVVRPVFSYYGKLTFTDDVLQALLRHTLKQVRGISAINKVKVSKSSEGTGHGVAIMLSVTVFYGENIKKLMYRVKEQVQHNIEYTTGMSVDVLKITIRGITPRKKA
jgi:uncharacterized alkaline shock family protein YloU